MRRATTRLIFSVSKRPAGLFCTLKRLPRSRFLLLLQILERRSDRGDNKSRKCTILADDSRLDLFDDIVRKADCFIRRLRSFRYLKLSHITPRITVSIAIVLQFVYYLYSAFCTVFFPAHKCPAATQQDGSDMIRRQNHGKDI